MLTTAEHAKELTSTSTLNLSSDGTYFGTRRTLTHQHEYVEPLVRRHVFRHAQNTEQHCGHQTLQHANLRATVLCKHNVYVTV